MTESLREQTFSGTIAAQCQYFVIRKKRLCRMTVRPGRQYCGEHEPQPKSADGQDDARIPCPNDPKHTVYVSKLEKHLSICNARATEQPPYIVRNINAPTEIETCIRLPLSQLSRDLVMQVIEKVNFLYDKHVKDNITVAPEHPIHRTVMEEFSESDRTESSLRHLRQVSSLLWLTEEEGLVADNTCYVELGAGKGHMSYYACNAWCSPGAGAAGAGSGALLVDRASLRHKRDNKLRGAATTRLRADLAHLALARVPCVANSTAVVGLAKHLCGVATDYALRCLSAAGVAHKARGAVVATCCHHRVQRAAFVANPQLQELGINGDELNVMLGIVSWATCGDGRSRGARPGDRAPGQDHSPGDRAPGQDHSPGDRAPGQDHSPGDRAPGQDHSPGDRAPGQDHSPGDRAPGQDHSPGDRAPGPDHSPGDRAPGQDHSPGDRAPGQDHSPGDRAPGQDHSPGDRAPGQDHSPGDRAPGQDHSPGDRAPGQDHSPGDQNRAPIDTNNESLAKGAPNDRAVLCQEQREQVGRRAKQLLDWARVLYLRGRGFDARLCYYVPTTVSLENVCIVAKKLS